MKVKNLVSPLYAEVKGKSRCRPRKRKATPDELPKYQQNRQIFEAILGIRPGTYLDVEEPVFGSLRPSIFLEIKGLRKHGHEFQTQRINTITRVWRLK